MMPDLLVVKSSCGLTPLNVKLASETSCFAAPPGGKQGPLPVIQNSRSMSARRQELM